MGKVDINGKNISKHECANSPPCQTICFYIWSITKRADAIALLDSGATENFMNLGYTWWLCLLIKCLSQPQPLFNVDGSENKSGQLLFYTDLHVWTGQQTTNLRFFLSDLGEQKAILGYPRFTAFQPCIDWKRGWINTTQLPVISSAPNAEKAKYVHRTQRHWLVQRERSILHWPSDLPNCNWPGVMVQPIAPL